MSDAPETPTPPPSNVIRLVSKRPHVLSDAHREHLRGSGLSDESIDGGGFWTEREGSAIAGMLNWKGWPRGRGDVLVLPFFVPGASDPYLCRVRPDQPFTEERKGKPPRIRKYEQPKDTPMGPYFPLRGRMHGWLADPERELVLVEGEKKAALLDQLGYAAVGGVGVDCFHDKAHRDETDQLRLHPLIAKHVTITGRRCLIAFDSDAADNDNVIRASRWLAWMLRQAGAADVVLVRIPPGPEDSKLGIDDFFVRHGEEETRKLLATALEPIDPLSGEDSRSLLKNYRALKDAPLDERLRMPRGYELGRDGDLLALGEEKTDVVERAPIFVSRLVSDLYNHTEQVEVVYRRHKSWRSVVIPRAAIADARAALRELAPLGAPIDSNTGSKVVKWLRDFESQNEKRIPRATSVSRCGWHRVAGEDVFMLGEPMRREGSLVELLLDKHQERARLASPLRTCGTYEAHLAAIKRAWDASPICAVVIASALAAPLLHPLRAPLFGVHLAGDSSKGKSSMLKVAASVFGDPSSEGWVANWNSTVVGHEVRAAFFSDLPLAIDEAGIADARDRERAVYMLVNGGGKTRGAKDGGLRETSSWRTVVLSTGERLLAEESTATGAQVRILQFQIDGFGDLDAGGVDAVRRSCEENFGHVGQEWIASLLCCSPEDWEGHRAALKARSRAFQALAAGSGLRARQAAFWALLAHVEATIHATLGIGREGGATMRELFEKPGASQLEVRPAADRALDLVREWITARPTSFPRLVVSSSGQKVAKGESAAREVFGYVDVAGEHLYLVPGALRLHLGEHGISDAVVLRDWRARDWIKSEGENRFSVKVRVGGKSPRMVALKGSEVGLTDSGSDDTPSDEW